MLNPVKVAEGGYGCVFRPALECENDELSYVKKGGYVSKAMSKHNADNELDEYKRIDEADPENKYHLEAPKKCKLSQTEKNLDSIKNCKVLEKVNKLDVMLLQLKDGGVSLKEFANSNPSREQMENFLVDFYNIILAIHLLFVETLRHMDLKPHNIVYNREKRLMLLIDFGLMVSEFENIDFYTGRPISHWNYPPEVYLLRQYHFLEKGWPFKNISRHITYQIENGTKNVIDYLKLTDEEAAKYVKDFEDDINSQRDQNALEQISFDTHDVFGTGLSLLYVLRNNKSKLDYNVYKTFCDLGFNMMHGAPSKRLTTEQTQTAYELALESTGLLRKQNKKIVNGVLVKRTHETKSKTQTVMERIKKLSSLSAIELEKVTSDNPPADYIRRKICQEDKELVGKRCLKKCAAGSIRNPATNRCVKNIEKANIRVRPAMKINPDCPDGKERNPETGRCVKKCLPDQIRSVKTRRCIKRR